MSAYISSHNFTASSAGPLLESSSVSWVSGSTRGEDSYVPDRPTSLPKEADIRAFRAALGEADRRQPASGPPRLPLLSPQAILCAAHGGWQAPQRGPGEEKDGVTVELPSNAELWYAQSAVAESYRKSEQLSFRPLRSRPGRFTCPA